jgi:hypothetical protein
MMLCESPQHQSVKKSFMWFLTMPLYEADIKEIGQLSNPKLFN